MSQIIAALEVSGSLLAEAGARPDNDTSNPNELEPINQTIQLSENNGNLYIKSVAFQPAHAAKNAHLADKNKIIADISKPRAFLETILANSKVLKLSRNQMYWLHLWKALRGTSSSGIIPKGIVGKWLDRVASFILRNLQLTPKQIALLENELRLKNSRNGRKKYYGYLKTPKLALVQASPQIPRMETLTPKPVRPELRRQQQEKGNSANTKLPAPRRANYKLLALEFTS